MKPFTFIAAILAAISCAAPKGGTDFTTDEIALISNADSLMRVLTIMDSLDNKVLRSKSTNLSEAALLSKEYNRLAELMVQTVTHPSQDGVGIAGPQVGLNRRVVAVQRFDKEGEPFEVYANIRIVEMIGEKVAGSEGCLSVPDMSGEVERYQEIMIEYDKPGAEIEKVQERISGFTAVIFQHECDHLDGILYIDRI